MVAGNVVDDADEWLTLGEFAKRLGITRGSVYGRIRRRTVETKPNGNRGYLIRWPPHAVTPNIVGNGGDNGSSNVAHNDGGDIAPNVMELRLALARLEEKLGAAERLLVERETTIADLRKERDRMTADARRPWLERLLEAIRRRT
jgi:hypothetical protein